VTGIALLLVFSTLLISYSLISHPTVGAQVDNAGTNLVGAVQEASQNGTDYLKAKITIEGLELSAEIPATGELMDKGLAIKNELKENESMLFVFDKPSRHSFWMKDMKFPIDIIWLDSNGKVVHIEKNLEPCTLVLVCPGYIPNADSQYVLETVSGFSQRNNIHLGTNVKVELME
jgi:uncharacterized membrane protein (UPF0127 family)